MEMRRPLLATAIFVLVMLESIIQPAFGYKKGAPDGACGHMMPKHKVDEVLTVGQTLTSNPYTFSFDALELRPGQNTTVHLSSPEGRTFAGFLLKAVSSNDPNKVVGRFVTSNSSLQTLSCGTIAGGLTHTGNERKSEIRALWIAPEDYSGSVELVATVVENYRTFWAKMNSLKRLMVSGTTQSGSTTGGGSSLYDGCSTTKGCFGFPSGCINSRNCQAIVTFAPDGDGVVFELMGKSEGYVAMGLSSDNMMGDDSITECVVPSSTSTARNVAVHQSYNVGKSNTRLTTSNLGLSNIRTMYEDGVIYCRFKRDAVTTINNRVYDLYKDKFNVLLAIGGLKPDTVDSIGYHNIMRTSSEEMISVAAGATLSVARSSPGITNPPSTTNAESSSGNAAVYDGCATTKGCFGIPSGCMNSKSCDALVTFASDSDGVVFEITGRTEGYVAMGLSRDQLMGSDSITECVVQSTEAKNVDVHQSYNVGRSNTRLTNSKLGLSNIEARHENGEIYCRFKRSTVTTVDNHVYDLHNDTHYILLALGGLRPGSVDTIGYHDKRDSSGQSVNVSSSALVSGSGPEIAVIVHGSLMVVAWICTVSIAIFLARYYKHMWPEFQHCGTKIWFAWHRGLNIITVLLTTAAFILIFVHINGWSGVSNQNPHPILGCITTGLMWIQPIMAAFRPHPGALKRPLFNWAHYVVGMSAHILAVVTIFFAVNLKRANLPNYFYWIMIAFVGFDVIMFIVMEIFTCMDGRKPAHNQIALRDYTGNGNGYGMNENGIEPQESRFKEVMLVLFLVGVTCFTAALVVVIVMSSL